MSEIKEIIKGAITAVFEYKGKRYVTKHDHYIYDEADIYPEQWRYTWEEGNYACDCNKSLFIQRQCEPDFPNFNCGQHKIRTVSLELRSGDGRR